MEENTKNRLTTSNPPPDGSPSQAPKNSKTAPKRSKLKEYQFRTFLCCPKQKVDAMQYTLNYFRVQVVIDSIHLFFFLIAALIVMALKKTNTIIEPAGMTTFFIVSILLSCRAQRAAVVGDTDMSYKPLLVMTMAGNVVLMIFQAGIGFWMTVIALYLDSQASDWNHNSIKFINLIVFGIVVLLALGLLACLGQLVAGVRLWEALKEIAKIGEEIDFEEVEVVEGLMGDRREGVRRVELSGLDSSVKN